MKMLATFTAVVDIPDDLDVQSLDAMDWLATEVEGVNADALDRVNMTDLRVEDLTEDLTR